MKNLKEVELLALADEIKRERGETLGMNGRIRMPLDLLDRIEIALRLAAAPCHGREGALAVLNNAKNLECDEQFYIADALARNVGYVLTGEPAHPDSPHFPVLGIAGVLHEVEQERTEAVNRQLIQPAFNLAWHAFQNTPIDLVGDSDDETCKCLHNAIVAYLSNLPPESTNQDSPTHGLGGAGEVLEALDAADYYLMRLNTAVCGKPVRDMDEASERWLQASMKVRTALAAKPAPAAVGEVREALESAAKIANVAGFTARTAIRSAKGPRERSKAIGAEEIAQHIEQEIRALSASPLPADEQNSRSIFEQILKHVTAPKRIASERLDNIERICREAIASPLPAGRASREEIIEECAKIAERLHEDPAWSPGYKSASLAIADKIRRLALDNPERVHRTGEGAERHKRIDTDSDFKAEYGEESVDLVQKKGERK